MLDAIKIYYKSTEAQQAKHNILSGHIFLHEICEVYSLYIVTNFFRLPLQSNKVAFISCTLSNMFSCCFFPVCSQYSIKHPACVFAERGTFLVPEMLRVVEVSAHPHWLTGVIHVPHRRGDRFVSDHPPVLTTDQPPSHVYIVPFIYISQAWNSSMSSKRQFS